MFDKSTQIFSEGILFSKQLTSVLEIVSTVQKNLNAYKQLKIIES